jgi:hypothetical protein
MQARRKFIKNAALGLFVPTAFNILVPSIAKADRRGLLISKKPIAAGGGPDVWYDNFSVSGGTGWAAIGASFMEYKTGLTVAVSGTATKLRLRHRGGLSDGVIKMAIYSDAGDLLGHMVTGNIVASSADTVSEINIITPFAIAAANYTFGFSASTSIEIRVNADGAGHFATQSHAGFPPATLPASEGAFDTVFGGVYVD